MRKILREVYPYIIIVVVVLLIKSFLVAPVRVVGPSMEHTLLNGDIMILDKISYRFNEIKRFDIVVVNSNEGLIIKRVIGLPGDKIEYKNNKLYINGEYYKEDYLDGDVKTGDFILEQLTGDETIPQGYYFVLGDNREESKDSRTIGLIKEKQIQGKARLTLFPFARFGIKK